MVKPKVEVLLNQSRSILVYIESEERKSLKDFDISNAQWRVIKTLHASRKPIMAEQLAKESNLLGPSVSRIMKSLTDRMLISKKVNMDSDRRMLDVRLTERGRQTHNNIHADIKLAYARVIKKLGSKNVNSAITALTALDTASPPPHAP